MGERAEVLKLTQILEYLLSGPRLKRQWFYRAHAVLGYTTDLVAAFGLTSPLVVLAVGSPTSNQNSMSLQQALVGVPSRYYVPAFAFVIVWVGIRVALAREDGEKRAVLALPAKR